PPLYTPRNDTLIQALQITPEEQKKLKTIISKEEAAWRHAERERQRRRLAGMAERSEYLESMAATTEERRKAALELRGKGLSQRAIAKELGITQQRVSKLLKK
ncbi:MAG TPA: replication protein, partial [Halomonas sp.]|nr:replication protein [Halomonas sp.]